MLMTQKAFVEGAQALIYYSAKLIDEQKVAGSKEEKLRCTLLLELLTPICKSWPSEFCLEANKLAIQVLGGYGYTREYPVERFYRDNRLNHIHEVTHAIHGLDILGRKVSMHNGAALKALVSEMSVTMEEANSISALHDYVGLLQNAIEQVQSTLIAISKTNNPELALANATIFLDAIGHVVIAWMWLKQAVAATKGLEKENKADHDFYNGKLSACQFFYNYELPKALTNLQLVAKLDGTCLDMDAKQFVGT